MKNKRLKKEKKIVEANPGIEGTRVDTKRWNQRTRWSMEETEHDHVDGAWST